MSGRSAIFPQKIVENVENSHQKIDPVYIVILAEMSLELSYLIGRLAESILTRNCF
jgi:hypothetical protein